LRTAQDRITELTTRQRYDGSGLVVMLKSVDGYFDYEVNLHVDTGETKMLPWVDMWKLNLKKNSGNQKIIVPPELASGKLVEARIVTECVIMKGKYNGEDPDELIKQAESLVGKWICGKQVTKPDGNYKGMESR